MPKQILIVDDNPIIRRLVRRCVESETGWHVCGEAENGAMALGMVTDLNPGLGHSRLRHARHGRPGSRTPHHQRGSEYTGRDVHDAILSATAKRGPRGRY